MLVYELTQEDNFFETCVSQGWFDYVDGILNHAKITSIRMDVQTFPVERFV